MLNLDLPGVLGAIVASAPRAGDVLLAVGCPPQVQVEGELVRIPVAGLERLTPYQTEAIVVHLLALAPPSSAVRVRQEGAAHFSYSVPGLNRFRVAVFSQRGSFAVSLRMIPDRVPALAELGLPDAMAEACRERSGVVLVNGPAGSGRTTSLAAMVAEVNRGRACHVVTIEDPIEFLHRHEKATINQREVGVDTPSLAHGISEAMRQGAQVVLAGEVRGREEARLLLDAAETGHLVMTTLRGLDTVSAVLRMLSFFAIEERSEVRSRLARALRWSFAQRILQHAEGRRAVVEVWRGTRAAAAHLAEGPLDSAAMAEV
ncbi:MAG: type IV pilus twitching motility protein PilT, partial [Acidobacteriota bacterium]